VILCSGRTSRRELLFDRRVPLLRIGFRISEWAETTGSRGRYDASVSERCACRAVPKCNWCGESVISSVLRDRPRYNFPRISLHLFPCFFFFSPSLVRFVRLLLQCVRQVQEVRNRTAVSFGKKSLRSFHVLVGNDIFAGEYLKGKRERRKKLINSCKGTYSLCRKITLAIYSFFLFFSSNFAFQCVDLSVNHRRERRILRVILIIEKY